MIFDIIKTAYIAESTLIAHQTAFFAELREVTIRQIWIKVALAMLRIH